MTSPVILPKVLSEGLKKQLKKAGLSTDRDEAQRQLLDRAAAYSNEMYGYEDSEDDEEDKED
jgi:hypothetical protein